MPTVQELIDEYARSKNSDIYKKIIKAVQTENKLWVAYSPVTKNNYIEYFSGKPSAFIFSEKAFCEDFKEHLAVHKVEIETELCKSETRIQFFSDLFRCGIENIILDNGKQFIQINIFDIIEKPDFSSLPKSEQPVFNQSLMVIANLFFQTFKAGTSTQNTRTKLLRSLYQAKYLMPVIIDRNTPLDGLENSFLKAIYSADGIAVTVPALKLENDDTLIPFFTDWTEFSRFDRDRQCAGNIVSFKDIEYLCSQGEKIAVNPFGFNMVIDNNALNLIKKVSSDIIIDEEYFEEIPEENSENDSEEYQEYIPQDDSEEYSDDYSEDDFQEDEEPITLFELRSVPNQMIQALMYFMQNTKGVHSAYLKGIKQGDSTGYLVIVDFEGDTSVLNDIAEQVCPYTQGASIDIILLDSDLGQQAAQSTYPFYQKT